MNHWFIRDAPDSFEFKSSDPEKFSAMIQPFHVYLYGPDGGPLSVSFEDAASRLQKLPKLGFEWDGSFVWALGPVIKGAAAEQVYGMMYDAGGAIQYCEIQGHCSLETWQTICQSILGPSPKTAENGDSLRVMRLPESQWQDLQSFERSTWQATEQPVTNGRVSKDS